MYVAIALVFAICWGRKIGEAGKARLARAYATPVIEALDRYHSVTHAYPSDLTESRRVLRNVPFMTPKYVV